ncbi:MAG: FtsX-like permease family protein [Chitinophagaceae bacterium]|nr:FtsX-like permease family protein [Chitinophagaceae bacterium]
MIKNYLKTSFRNLMKNKTFSFINIAGLSIGMAACLLILQYVSFQLSYDQFNKNAGDLYRVYNDRYQNGKLIQHGTITYSAIGKAMQDDFPEVINHARLQPRGKEIITWKNKKIGELEVKFADNSFLSMFSYPLMTGDLNTALKEPHTVVMSESAARKIFGVEDNNFSAVTGNLFIMGRDSTPYKITAICKDVPENSHLTFDILGSYITLYTGADSWKEADYDFRDSDFWHYVQLKQGTDYKALQAKFPAFSQRHFQGNKISGSDEKFYLQPLSKAHLYSDFEYEIGNTDSAVVVWGLLIIAALIIIIAWVNYINLATSRSIERAKEVGIRKVSGATRIQLIKQFLTESLLINIIALLTALLLVLLVQSSFNELVQHKLSLSYLFQKGLNGYNVSIALITLMLAGIFVSGFYPAFILSSFKPILVLKGKFTTSGKGILLRKSLVIGQFAITVILIIGSFVVYKQIKYVNEQNLGFNLSQVLLVKPPELTDWDSTFIDRENTFTEELKQIPGITGAATSWNLFGGETGRTFNVRRSDQDENTHLTMRHTAISIGYLDLYQIKVLAGRDFESNDFNPDFEKVHNILLNESAVKLLGYASPADAIGKIMMRGNKKWEITGVINDYHQKSLRYPIEPTMLMPGYSTNSYISVKVNPLNLPATIAAIKTKYDAFFPGNLFDYSFVDDRFNAQYRNDQLFGKVFTLFSGFAIFIASLGLLGLSLFATIQRTKEIGIRKVLGASVSNIVLLLSKDFIKLVVIAFVVAAPLAWLIMHKWLQDFAYRINISWWIFLIAGLLAVIIALATISFQAVKAAVANPVKSLRSE